MSPNFSFTWPPRFASGGFPRREGRRPFPFQTLAPMLAVLYRTAIFCSGLFWITATPAGPLPGLHRTGYRSEGRFPLLTDDSWHLHTVIRRGARCAASGRIRKEKTTEHLRKNFPKSPVA